MQGTIGSKMTKSKSKTMQTEMRQHHLVEENSHTEMRRRHLVQKIIGLKTTITTTTTKLRTRKRGSKLH